MSKTSINISSQNITEAAARNSIADNPNGYFQVVSFYLAREGGDSTCANSTGFVVEFDENLKVLGYDENFVFQSVVRDSTGRKITNRGRGMINQQVMGDNKVFVSTSSAEEYDSDGYLFFACVQFPTEVSLGDTFTISIDTHAEFICENSLEDTQQRESDTEFARNHVIPGTFTIV